MRNYPEQIEEKLGLDQIRKRIAAFCYGPLGRDLCLKAAVSDQAGPVTLWLSQTGEWISLLHSGEPVPEGNYLDISKPLRKLEIEGYFLQEEEFHEIRLVLRTLENLTRFFAKLAESYPLMAQLLDGIPSQRNLIQSIEKVIDEEGLMRHNASQALADISAAIHRNERELHRKAQQLLGKARKEGWSADTELSVREGRLVIPILAEHKRKIKGIVHDESARGQILYIEPTEIIELNNELRELQVERRREAERILTELSAYLAPHRHELLEYNKKLGLMDFIRAKALFARDIDARIPEINTKGKIEWKKAFHPLLLLHHRQSKMPTVPLDITLSEENRILLISGPNAGGKSVALKTTGLLQYMTQCGFPVPVGEGSSTRIFSGIFIDIGDDQSLDNDLSTYSSHLTNMKHFLRYARKGTLILIDEFGTGTDPQFGGPMAEAILEELNRRNCYGVVTTHYSNLKLLAGKLPGLINGSMSYDTEKLQPLYKLETGKPGSSFAFEVAAKIGLPGPVIDRARKKVGAKQKNVDDLIFSLEKERQELEELEGKAREAQSHYSRLLEEYRELKQQLESRRKEILQQAREEAYQLLKNSNSLIERTVRELKEGGKEARPVSGTRKELNEQKRKLEASLKLPEESKEREVPQPGDQVKIRGQQSVGRLLEIHKHKATVEFGEIRTQVDLKKLEKVGRKEARELKRITGGFDLVNEMQEFRMDLDVRGKRGEEALRETVAFLDRALVLGFDKLRIIHGHGDGILKKLIRQELKSYPAVERIESESEEQGGDGVSIVHLR